VDSIASLRCCHIPHLPAEPELVEWWATTFRNPDTGSNYVTALKKAHVWAGMDIAFNEKKARAILKGRAKIEKPVRRVKRRIQKSLLEKLAAQAVSEGKRDLADCMIISYWFALRVQSELIPLKRSGGGYRCTLSSTKTARIHLAKRKNRPEGETLMRRCSCHISKTLCPHRALERRMAAAQQREDGRICTIRYVRFNDEVRRLAGIVGAPSPEEFASHAFRRGFSRDLLEARTPLKQVLEACGWSSTAFALYMGQDAIEGETALDMAEGMSGSENDS
jgi:hypothetical protein